MGSLIAIGGRIANVWSVTRKLHNMLEFIFGCWHRKLSRPFTLSGWTYEVCLNCGKKFAYDRADLGYYVHGSNDELVRREFRCVSEYHPSI